MFSFRLTIFMISLSAVLFNSYAQKNLQWEPVLTNTNTNAIALNPLDNRILYTMRSGQFYVSYDRGDNWNIRGSIPGHDLRNIVVCPTDTSLIILYGQGSLLRSTDSGFTWTIVLSGVGLDGETLQFSPVTADTVYFSDFYGSNFYVSTDTGATWQIRTTIPTPTICALAVSPDRPGTFVAGGGNTRAVLSTDYGYTWTEIKPANPFFSEIPKIVWDATEPGVAFGSSYLDPDNSFYRFSDYGNQWQQISLDGTYFWGIDIHPLTGDIYAGVFGEDGNKSVFASYDDGSSWQKLGNNFPDNDVWMIRVATDSSVYALSLAFFGNGTIYRLKPPPLGKVTGQLRDSTSGIPLSNGLIINSATDDTVSVRGLDARYTVALHDTTARLTAFVDTLSATTDLLTFSAGIVDTVDILLSSNLQPIAFEGRVINPDSQPLEAALTLYGKTATGSAQVFTATTDSAGTYRFTSILNNFSPDSLIVEPEVPYLDTLIINPQLPDTLDLVRPTSDVLLYGNNLGNGNRSAAAANLHDLGFSVSHWNLQTDGDSLPARKAALTNRKLVIYLNQRTPSPGYFAPLDNFLSLAESGVNLLLADQDLVENAANHSFISDRIGVSFAGNFTTSSVVRGFANNPFAGGLTFSVLQVLQPSRDIMAINTARPEKAMSYGASAADTLQIGAVTVENSGNWARAIVLGFDMVNVNLSTQKLLFERAMAYFDRPVSIRTDSAPLPGTTALLPNYPNPFNPETFIRFVLERRDEVSLNVYNLLGEHVVEIYDRQGIDAGQHQVVWDGRDQFGKKVSSGFYIAMMSVSGKQYTQRLLLIR